MSKIMSGCLMSYLVIGILNWSWLGAVIVCLLRLWISGVWNNEQPIIDDVTLFRMDVLPQFVVVDWLFTTKWFTREHAALAERTGWLLPVFHERPTSDLSHIPHRYSRWRRARLNIQLGAFSDFSVFHNMVSSNDLSVMGITLWSGYVAY